MSPINQQKYKWKGSLKWEEHEKVTWCYWTNLILGKVVITFSKDLLNISIAIYEPIECPTFTEKLHVSYSEFQGQNQKLTFRILCAFLGSHLGSHQIKPKWFNGFLQVKGDWLITAIKEITAWKWKGHSKNIM